jgi:hypothetical protein
MNGMIAAENEKWPRFGVKNDGGKKRDIGGILRILRTQNFFHTLVPLALRELTAYSECSLKGSGSLYQ